MKTTSKSSGTSENIDTEGQTIDVLLTARSSDQRQKWSEYSTLAVLNADREDDERIKVRQSKYLNSLTEQDHRNIKRRIRLIPGFKSFRRAQAILAGIELVHMIRKR